MSAVVEFQLNVASAAQIADHLLRCDAYFIPPLSDRVEIGDYAERIASKATRFEAWLGGRLIGLVAAYCNDHEKRVAYITSVSVLRAWTGKGIAAQLLGQCVETAKSSGMRQICLEVAQNNAPAIKLYEESGFVAEKSTSSVITMGLNLGGEGKHERQA